MPDFKRQKITNIQLLRAIASLLVFAAHIVGAERDYGGGATLLPGFLEMGVTGVDLFFLISGFVMVYVTWPLARSTDKQSTSSLKAVRQFLVRRIARIYPLYWIVTILLLLLYGGKKVLFGEDTPITNYVESFLLLPSYNFPIIPVGWTLVHEMYFYIMFAFVLLFPYRIRPYLIVLWAVVIGIGYAQGWQNSNAWGLVIFSPLTYEFIFGCFIAWITMRGTTGSGKPILFISIAWLFCLLVPLGTLMYPQAVADHGVRAVIFTLPFGMLLYAAVALEWSNAKTGPKWLAALGDASYALYLIHIPVFLVTGKIMSQISGPGLFDNVILIGVYILSGIGTALLAHRYIEKPIIRYSRKRWG